METKGYEWTGMDAATRVFVCICFGVVLGIPFYRAYGVPALAVGAALGAIIYLQMRPFRQGP